MIIIHKNIRDDAEQTVMESGYASQCVIHPGVLVYQYDDEALRRAYAITMQRWNAGYYSAMLPSEELMDAVRQAVDNVTADCPDCARMEDR